MSTTPINKYCLLSIFIVTQLILKVNNMYYYKSTNKIKLQNCLINFELISFKKTNQNNLRLGIEQAFEHISLYL